MVIINSNAGNLPRCTLNAVNAACTILSCIKSFRFSVYGCERIKRARHPRNGTGLSNQTNTAHPFSNMTVQLRLVNLLKNVNSTMFLLAVCGRRLFPESRIVGGNRSSFGKWPWQVSDKSCIITMIKDAQVSSRP
jgi:hypothetical protein